MRSRDPARTKGLQRLFGERGADLMPTECFDGAILNLLPRKPVHARFDGGDLTSDAGLLLMAQVDQRLGLTARLAQCIRDRRQSKKTRFTAHELLAQRIFGLVAGYEDANDHDSLRADSALKVAVGRRPDQSDLATQPTLSRFENRITVRELVHMARTFLELFVDMHRGKPPSRIVLDFDATDDPTHGQQVLSGFHGYYDRHCFLPLVITAQCDGGPHEPLLAILRPGKSHAAKGTASILKRILEVIRSGLPETEISLNFPFWIIVGIV